MVLKRGKFGKPRRGGSHHFSSTRDPNAYITARTPRHDEDEGSEESGSGSDVDQVQEKLSIIDIGGTKSESEDEESDEEEEASKEAKEAKEPKEAAAPPKQEEKPKPKQFHELSRREREAIEKERARQHFLKMKEKEDAARLAEIRKKREQEAAAHAAALKEKEAARLSRRQ